jgi:hypothetical protein
MLKGCEVDQCAFTQRIRQNKNGVQKKVMSSVILLQFFFFEHKHFKFYTGSILIAEFPNVIHVCLGLLISFHRFLTST